MSKLVRDNNSFCPGKVRENEFCKVVGTVSDVSARNDDEDDECIIWC